MRPSKKIKEMNVQKVLKWREKKPKPCEISKLSSKLKQPPEAASSFADYASTAVDSDAVYKATQSLSSVTANAAPRTLDSTNDYVYSTWDDRKLRNYLE